MPRQRARATLQKFRVKTANNLGEMQFRVFTLQQCSLCATELTPSIPSARLGEQMRLQCLNALLVRRAGCGRGHRRAPKG